MKQMIKTTILGMKDLPGFGSHPGDIPLIGMFIIGGAAGWDGGILMALTGSLILGGVFGTLYLMGAYGRGSDYLKSQRNKNEN